jgi:transcriptional regulator with XRE-family HTH domain
MAKALKPRASTKFDIYMGERIREARISVGMTQDELGNLLGVSFQQIQKYEKGVNRVSGARLDAMVTALNRPLTFFFSNLTDVRAKVDPVMSAWLATKEGLHFATTYPRLAQPDQRMVSKLLDRLSTGSI